MGDGALAVILKGKQAGIHREIGFFISEIHKDDPVDFLDESRTVGDDHEFVPVRLLVGGLYGCGVRNLLDILLAIGVDVNFLAGGCEMAAVFRGQKRVMPQAHFVLLRHFYLVAAYLKRVDLFAAHLHAGVATGEFEEQAQLKVAEFATAPDDPVFLGLAAGQGD